MAWLTLLGLKQIHQMANMWNCTWWESIQLILYDYEEKTISRSLEEKRSFKIKIPHWRKKGINKWRIKILCAVRYWTLKAGYEKLLNGSRCSGTYRTMQVLWSSWWFGGMFDTKAIDKNCFNLRTNGVGAAITLLNILADTNQIKRFLWPCVLTILSLCGAEPSAAYIAVGKNEPAKLEQNRCRCCRKVVYKLVALIGVVKTAQMPGNNMVKMTMTWLDLLSVLQKNLKSSMVQK